MCEHMRDRGSAKRERETETERERERDKRALGSERDNETKRKKKITKQGLFQMTLPEYQTPSAVSNLMEKASFCKSRNLQCFQDPL